MKKGMNTEAVDRLAGQVLDSVDGVQTTFQTSLDSLTELDWTGDDRDIYVSEYDTVGDAVEKVKTGLSTLSERLTSNAAAQRTASS